MPQGAPSVIPETRPNPDPTIFSKELVDKEIQHLRELLEARMEGRDQLTDERLRNADNDLDKLQRLADSQLEGLRSQINGLKERLDRGDGKIVGQAYKDTGGQQTIAFVFALLATLIALAGLAVSIFKH